MSHKAQERFCEAIDEWAALIITSEVKHERGTFGDAWRTVRLAISKSCLLSRTLYGGERPSKTPCPVHKGTWSGIQWPEPMTIDAAASEATGAIVLVPAASLGCRCAQHKSCNCTTGWQPDEHCGCLAPTSPKDGLPK